MLKKILVAAVGVTLLVGLLAYLKLGQFTAMGEAAEAMVMPPSTVNASVIEAADWEQAIISTGSVSPVQGVIVSAETGGRVVSIDFDSDQAVATGQTLLRLDTSIEESELAAAEASAELARNNLRRLQELVKKKLDSEDAVDRAKAEVKKTAAQVGMINAAINKKHVQAPFSGRLGIRQVDLGQILSEGDPIVVLQMLSEVYVDFSIPQQKLSRIERGMKVRVTSDATPDRVFEGEITAINLEVNTFTRNVQVRALISNPEEFLHVGMFTRVEVVLPATKRVLAVPATAVLYAPFGNSVFVIDTKKNEESGDTEQVLRQQFIKLGEARGDFVDVTSGLEAGETVVTSGVFKLQSGTRVVIDNTLEPEHSLNPVPGDS